MHNKLKFRRRPDLHIEGVEDIVIEIMNENKNNIIISVMYRPPSQHLETFLDKLDESLHNISQENKDVYFMRDYNIDLLSLHQSISSRF